MTPERENEILEICDQASRIDTVTRLPLYPDKAKLVECVDDLLLEVRRLREELDRARRPKVWTT